MTMKNTSSRMSGLSPEDLAILAEARTSESDPNTRQTSASEAAASWLRQKGVLQPEIEPNSPQLDFATQKPTFAYSSPQITGAQQSIAKDIADGLRGMALRGTSGDLSPIRGYPEFNQSPRNRQVGGNHYQSMPIQPAEFIHRNGIGFLAGNVIKYVCRYRAKGGVQDLEKARHYIDMLIEEENSA
jgi:hypothetical protein